MGSEAPLLQNGMENHKRKRFRFCLSFRWKNTGIKVCHTFEWKEFSIGRPSGRIGIDETMMEKGTKEKGMKKITKSYNKFAFLDHQH